jgi:two-component system cell cycle response regulator DivK
MNWGMLSRRLMRRGYEVVLAVDGEEGLAAAVTERPQLILMDLSLPGIDGWEATRQLKANPVTNAIPVIALTAHALTTDRDRAMIAGFGEYGTKSVELPRLLEKIETLIGPPAGAAS